MHCCRYRMADLFAYLCGIARSEGFTLAAAGGTTNHVHLLIVLPSTLSVATAVQKLKGGSSRWLGKGFAWQEGYGAFSVSPSQVAAVKRYIARRSIIESGASKRSSRICCGGAGWSTIRGLYLGKFRRPYGTHRGLAYVDPTLKRGANERCAYGAVFWPEGRRHG